MKIPFFYSSFSILDFVLTVVAVVLDTLEVPLVLLDAFPSYIVESIVSFSSITTILIVYQEYSRTCLTLSLSLPVLASTLEVRRHCGHSYRGGEGNNHNSELLGDHYVGIYRRLWNILTFEEGKVAGEEAAVSWPRMKTAISTRIYIYTRRLPKKVPWY